MPLLTKPPPVGFHEKRIYPLGRPISQLGFGGYRTAVDPNQDGGEAYKFGKDPNLEGGILMSRLGEEKTKRFGRQRKKQKGGFLPLLAAGLGGLILGKQLGLGQGGGTRTRVTRRRQVDENDRPQNQPMTTNDMRRVLNRARQREGRRRGLPQLRRLAHHPHRPQNINKHKQMSRFFLHGPQFSTYLAQLANRQKGSYYDAITGGNFENYARVLKHLSHWIRRQQQGSDSKKQRGGLGIGGMIAASVTSPLILQLAQPIFRSLMGQRHDS